MKRLLVIALAVLALALSGCGEQHVTGKVGRGWTTRALTPHYWYTYEPYSYCYSQYNSYSKSYRYTCSTRTRTITHVYYRWETQYWINFREWGGDNPGRIDCLQVSDGNTFQLLHSYHSEQALLKLSITPDSPCDDVDSIAETH